MIHRNGIKPAYRREGLSNPHQIKNKKRNAPSHQLIRDSVRSDFLPTLVLPVDCPTGGRSDVRRSLRHYPGVQRRPVPG